MSFLCRFRFGAASSSLTSGRHIPFAVLCRPLTERSLPFGRSWRFGSVWRSFNFTKHFCLSFLRPHYTKHIPLSQEVFR
nr:MAG TPA: hypothetical protein [Caudoviricetes sp.]